MTLKTFYDINQNIFMNEKNNFIFYVYQFKEYKNKKYLILY
jgi:hypothetical protein